MRSASPRVLSLLALVLSLCRSGAVPPAAAGRTRLAFDPQALQLLQKMSDAYAHTVALDQRTVYYSALIPLEPPRSAPPPTSHVESSSDSAPPTPQDQKMDRSLHLIVMPPNRVRMDLDEPDPKFDDKRRVSIWDSDGKTFWTYDPETHYYTKEKSPTRRADLVKMRHMTTGSLELMMLFGVNPFANIRDQADGAQVGSPETVHGALTDVVILSTVALSSVTHVRFYIDRDSGLLRRLVVETTPMKYSPPSEPGRVGDDLDVLVNDRHAPIPPSDIDQNQPQNITRVTYDNLFGPAESVNLTDFTFKIPQNALLYAPFEMGKPIGPSLREMLRGLNLLHGRKLRIIKP